MNALRISALVLIAIAGCGGRQLVGTNQDVDCSNSAAAICPTGQSCAPNSGGSCVPGQPCPGKCKPVCNEVNSICPSSKHWDSNACACVDNPDGGCGGVNALCTTNAHWDPVACACVTTCNVDSDCSQSSGATCTLVCQDGKNPCVDVCVNHGCVARGCPSVDGGITDAGSNNCTRAGGTCTGPFDCNGQIAQSGLYTCPGSDYCCLPITDASSCQPLTATCSVNSDCCSGNCNLHTSPGSCCVPGGCP